MSGAVPLTWAERSVWLASLLSANPLSYNAASILAIDGVLSTQRLLDSLHRALAGAELLSLRVVADEGDLFWRRHDHAAGAPIIDVLADAQSDPLAQLSQIFYTRPIKADRAALIAIHVLKQHPGRHYVMIRHHHVVLDFQGAAALLHRVAAIYSGDDPPPSPERRADIALAERAYLHSDGYRADENYWRGRMRGLAPGALSNPAHPSPTAVKIDFAISPDTFAAFASGARASGSTPFQSLLLIAYAYLQSEQQGDVIFGVPLSGRGGGVLNSQSLMLPFLVNAPPAQRRDAVAAIRRALKSDIERSRFPIWQNTELIFPAERRGALPKVALNYMRAASFRFGAATGTIAGSLYGERNADTYIRCVEAADGQFSISLESGGDRPWVEGFSQAIKAGLASEGLAG